MQPIPSHCLFFISSTNTKTGKINPLQHIWNNEVLRQRSIFWITLAGKEHKYFELWIPLSRSIKILRQTKRSGTLLASKVSTRYHAEANTQTQRTLGIHQKSLSPNLLGQVFCANSKSHPDRNCGCRCNSNLGKEVRRCSSTTALFSSKNICRRNLYWQNCWYWLLGILYSTPERADIQSFKIWGGNKLSRYTPTGHQNLSTLQVGGTSR